MIFFFCSYWAITSVPAIQVEFAICLQNLLLYRPCCALTLSFINSSPSLCSLCITGRLVGLVSSELWDESDRWSCLNCFLSCSSILTSFLALKAELEFYLGFLTLYPTFRRAQGISCQPKACICWAVPLTWPQLLLLQLSSLSWTRKQFHP